MTVTDIYIYICECYLLILTLVYIQEKSILVLTIMFTGRYDMPELNLQAE